MPSYRFMLPGGDCVTLAGDNEACARRTLAEHQGLEPHALVLAELTPEVAAIMGECSLGCDAPCTACLGEAGLQDIAEPPPRGLDEPDGDDGDDPDHELWCDCSYCRPDLVRLPAWTGWATAAVLGMVLLMRRRG